MTDFRHKCAIDADGNPIPKTQATMDAYRDAIRRLYPVPEDAWRPLYDTPHHLARLGMTVETGRQVAMVDCPDCGAVVTVTREKPEATP